MYTECFYLNPPPPLEDFFKTYQGGVFSVLLFLTQEELVLRAHISGALVLRLAGDGNSGGLPNLGTSNLKTPPVLSIQPATMPRLGP